MTRDLLFGAHAVAEWLEADPSRLEAVLVSPEPNPRVQALVARAREAGVPIETIAPKRLQALAHPRNPQGIAARARPYPYADLEAVLEAAAPPVLLLAVDGVTDPGNLGAIVRSAAFFSATAVLLPRDRSATVTPVVERAAAGALARVPVCQVDSLVRTVGDLRDRGFDVLGAILGPHPAPASLDLTGALVAVVGSEGSGIRPSVRRLCTLKTALPGRGPASLNVAAFTAVLLYEIGRQRGLKP